MFKTILRIIKSIIFYRVNDIIRPGSFKKVMDLFFIILEKFAYVFEPLTEPYINVYYEMVEKELNLLKLYPMNSILVIGSGSIPSTPIIISRKTKAQITSIDIDKEAVKKSKEIIKRLNLSNRINIENKDGEYYTFQNFDAIFVLYGMKKQMNILDNISNNIRENIPIIFRTVSHNEYSLVDNRPFDLSNIFQIKKKIKSHSWGIVESYLLIKKIN